MSPDYPHYPGLFEMEVWVIHATLAGRGPVLVGPLDSRAGEAASKTNLSCSGIVAGQLFSNI